MYISPLSLIDFVNSSAFLSNSILEYAFCHQALKDKDDPEPPPTGGRGDGAYSLVAPESGMVPITSIQDGDV